MKILRQMANQDIRDVINTTGIKQADVAAELGYSYAWFNHVILNTDNEKARKIIIQAVIRVIERRDQHDRELIAELENKD